MNLVLNKVLRNSSWSLYIAVNAKFWGINVKMHRALCFAGKWALSEVLRVSSFGPNTFFLKTSSQWKRIYLIMWSKFSFAVSVLQESKSKRKSSASFWCSANFSTADFGHETVKVTSDAASIAGLAETDNTWKRQRNMPRTGVEPKRQIIPCLSDLVPVLDRPHASWQGSWTPKVLWTMKGLSLEVHFFDSWQWKNKGAYQRPDRAAMTAQWRPTVISTEACVGQSGSEPCCVELCWRGPCGGSQRNDDKEDGNMTHDSSRLLCWLK